ncbi:MAG: hypothetical protein FJ135_13830 [Deltaproteobacteria bacterium]|nr:hypothetical protein [Deltaproteobacteria bacterium]
MFNLLKPFLLAGLMAAVLILPADSRAQLRKAYDPQKVITVQGQVEKLETITRQGRQARNNRQTQIARLKTDQGELVVHLGPEEFLAGLHFRPKVGDVLEITGGKIRTRQGEVILANTVKSGSQTFQLRDGQGVPVWTGQTPGCMAPPS